MDNEIPSLSAEIELRDSPEMFLKRDADSSSAVIAAVVVTDRRCGDAGDELPRRRASVEVDANGVSTRRSPFGALPTKNSAELESVSAEFRFRSPGKQSASEFSENFKKTGTFISFLSLWEDKTYRL